MKKYRMLKSLGYATLAVFLPPLASSAEDLIVFRFNTPGSVTNNWVKWWGSAPTTVQQDPTQDVNYNPTSGSLKATVTFNLAAYGGDNQFALRAALSGDGNLNGKVVDATKYDHLEFDLFWDGASPMRGGTDYGGLEVGLVPVNYSQIWFTNMAITTVGQWQHIRLPVSYLDPTQTNLATIGGVVLKMWSGDSASGQTGTATFWVDNMKLVPKGFITDVDNSSYIDNGAFWNWWGGAARTVQFDPAKDANGDTNSGSLNISVTFAGTGDNQYAEGMSLSGSGTYNSGITIHTPDYTSLDFDLLLDPASTLTLDTINSNGDPQGLGMGLGAASGWGQTWIPYATQPRVTNDGVWHHVSIPLDPAWPDIGGLIFKKYFNTGAQFTGTMNFWVDNIRFIPSSAPLPPPSMSLKKAHSGLNLLLSQSGQQYQREAIYSIPGEGVSFYGNSSPVSYSVTIADFPSGATYGGVQNHIILVPDPSSGNAVDYSDPNAIMLDIRQNAAGAGTATFRYKTNSPNANGQMYNTSQGQLGTLTAPTVIGTWTLTFANNTNITINGPGGTSLNLALPPDSAALFSTSLMGTYFGIQPNNSANIGQGVALSEIKIMNGSTVVVDDHFTTVDPTQQVDPSLWRLKMDNPAGIFVATEQPSFFLGWTLPDVNFALYAKTNLNSAGFDPGFTLFQNGPFRTTFLAPSSLAATNRMFFYLQK